MRQPGKLSSRLAFGYLACLAILANAGAEPARDRVLEEVSVLNGPNSSLIEIAFSTPMQYRGHFPATHGDEIRVQLQPQQVMPADADAMTKRESVRPPGAAGIGLIEVTYDGDMDGGPYLVIEFSHEVPFIVSPGKDFRSIAIAVFPRDDTQPDPSP